MAIGVLAAIEAASCDDIQFLLGGAGLKEMIARTGDGDAMTLATLTYSPAMIATAIEVMVVGLTSTAPASGLYWSRKKMQLISITQTADSKTPSIAWSAVVVCYARSAKTTTITIYVGLVNFNSKRRHAKFWRPASGRSNVVRHRSLWADFVEKLENSAPSFFCQFPVSQQSRRNLPRAGHDSLSRR